MSICRVLLAQQFSISLGVNTGIMSSRTIDDGISRDPRYKQYYNVKFAPIGVNIGINYEYVGLMVSPTVINVGQNAYLLNTSNGQVGKRNINERYLNVPVAFKVHLVNLVFLKISGIASLSAAYLIDGRETVTHNDSKLDFPKEVYPILPADYHVEYDGVAVPVVDKYVIAGKSDFRSLQVFAGAGFQSDWDISNSWRVTFDLRINYGLFDPRTSAYISKLDARQTLYDMPGTRHDVFTQLSVGIARYIEFDKNDQDRKKKLKGSKKGYRVMPNNKVKSPRPRG
ncbi:MAG: outer membrane beta-barrel protein [Chryseolinea sp.]